MLDQLEAFLAVVKNGGFERASDSIHRSQPAISLRIKALENRLGVELFHPTRRRARLTNAGKIVEQYAARLMNVLSEMNQAVDELKGLLRGELRCGGSTTIASHLLPKVLVHFKKSFPNIGLVLLGGKTTETERRVLAGEIDIGFVTGTLQKPHSFNIFHLLTDEFVLITPRHHALAKFRKVSLKHLKNVPLILRQKGSLQRRIIDESFRAAGISYHCIMEIETTEALKKAVAEGLGCSIASFYNIEAESKSGELAYVKISGSPMKRDFRVILDKDKRISGPSKPFLELLGIKINSQSQ